MNLGTLQNLAEQSLVEQWETLLARFQSDRRRSKIGIWRLSTL